MNEKIKELLDKAEVYYNDDMYSDYNDLASLEKFADLIIKECADYANWYQANSRYTDIAKAIKEYFGVEE